MLTPVMPYVNYVVEKIPECVSYALAKVPKYGKWHALGFACCLIYEARQRNLRKERTRPEKYDEIYERILWMKSFQVSIGIIASPAFNSLISKIAAGFFTFILYHPFFIQAIDSKPKDWNVIQEFEVHLDAERPSASTFFAFTIEVVNIALKITNSLAAGVVVQKMWNGQVEGKVRFVVATVLLGLSAYNICKFVKPHGATSVAMEGGTKEWKW